MIDAELEKMAEEAARREYGSDRCDPGFYRGFKAGYKKAREWIKTSERKPLLSDYHKHVLTCSAEGERNRTMVGWIHEEPEKYPYWQELPAKPEGVE